MGWLGGTLGLVAVVLLSACGGGSVVPTAGAEGAAGAAPTSTPSATRITCEPTRTSVVGTRVAVQRDGLHVVVVDSSGRAGTYLNYEYRSPNQGAGGGDPVTPGRSERVLTTPPGRLKLSCSYDNGSTDTSPVSVVAVDPHGYFRKTSLADLGCRGGNSQPSWAIGPARGSTPSGAVAALLAKAPEAKALTAALAPIGYVGAEQQTHVVSRHGKPWATALVTPEGGQFSASFDQLC